MKCVETFHLIKIDFHLLRLCPFCPIWWAFLPAAMVSYAIVLKDLLANLQVHVSAPVFFGGKRRKGATMSRPDDMLDIVRRLRKARKQPLSKAWMLWLTDLPFLSVFCLACSSYVLYIWLEIQISDPTSKTIKSGFQAKTRAQSSHWILWSFRLWRCHQGHHENRPRERALQ